MGLYDDTGTLIAAAIWPKVISPNWRKGQAAHRAAHGDHGERYRHRRAVHRYELVMATQDYVDDKLAEHEQSLAILTPR